MTLILSPNPRYSPGSPCWEAESSGPLWGPGPLQLLSKLGCSWTRYSRSLGPCSHLALYSWSSLPASDSPESSLPLSLPLKGTGCSPDRSFQTGWHPGTQGLPHSRVPHLAPMRAARSPVTKPTPPQGHLVYSLEFELGASSSFLAGLLEPLTPPLPNHCSTPTPPAPSRLDLPFRHWTFGAVKPTCSLGPRVLGPALGNPSPPHWLTRLTLLSPPFAQIQCPCLDVPQRAACPSLCTLCLEALGG